MKLWLQLSHHLRLRPRLSIAVLAGALLATVWPSTLPLLTRLLLGWNVGVWTYLLLILWHIGRADSAHVQRQARALAQGMPVVLVLAVIGALASLAAIALEQAQVRHGGNVVQGWPYLLLAITTVAGSWLLLPVEFALAYASLYHRGDAGAHGLEFPGDTSALDYSDFLYFSITLAATSQTSDVTVSSRAMRKLVLLQALLSFVFNTGVLALTINILASLIG
ncbi:DUF1345 domain-containing protein [Paucibacter sp. APW11]|uniref:DUF1345 domain-containing protein n=1 Tax=Roseateles aquae TaxID=3077235 RepID=A0ABU3PAZ4_9BURK|nr:DUF1345 domain-containing protein [Paucibacter sp. APW11]MDT8998921.1 DUF1345 domain-containing protein [Paucibacter sp. APW11]